MDSTSKGNKKGGNILELFWMALTMASKVDHGLQGVFCLPVPRLYILLSSKRYAECHIITCIPSWDSERV